MDHKPVLLKQASNKHKLKRKENNGTDHKPVLLKQASNKQELTKWENILITNKTKITL